MIRGTQVTLRPFGGNILAACSELLGAVEGERL